MAQWKRVVVGVDGSDERKRALLLLNSSSRNTAAWS